jgi:peptidoglycan/xylan/chitin deacetylase (PgdA/CDA1 family)
VTRDGSPGAFTVSIDFELIWGTLDLFGPDGFKEACRIEREVVVQRLLDLFEEYEVSATWCVLGHLFLDRCHPHNGTKHPEIVPPRHAWVREPWFAHDPCTDEARSPEFYGRTLVEKIRACRVPQELACHSFSHVIFGDPGCSEATAETEVDACVRVAREMGIELKSFAFPRNRVGHLPVLVRHGFRSYRGPGERWYESEDATGVLGRLAHLWDVVRAALPPTVVPERDPSGLWNIPGSMIYFPMHGIRRLVPVSRRVKRAVKGLDEAARTGRIFHLWFHPTNLSDRTEAMFAGLRTILIHAARLRQEGRLVIASMDALVPTAA